MDAKIEGDLVYVIGQTSGELGGSEYFAHLGNIGNTVPELDTGAAKIRYEKVAVAIAHELIASAFPVSYGGLGVALAKVAVAGQVGMNVTISTGMRPDYFLFSESLGRFIVTIAPDNKRAFERMFNTAEGDSVLLGRVGGTRLRVTARNLLIDVDVAELEKAYKSPFRGY